MLTHSSSTKFTVSVKANSESNNNAGTYTVSCKVSDGSLESESAVFTLTVLMNKPVTSTKTLNANYDSIDVHDTVTDYTWS